MRRRRIDAVPKPPGDASAVLAELDLIHLADALDALASFLDTHHESDWADRIAHDAIEIRRGNRRGLARFLSAFGGMGSLNDLVFSPLNGNSSSEDAAELNVRFDRLRHAAWEQAIALRE